MRSAALAAIAAACAAQAVVPSAPFSIDAFGAVAGVDTQAAALANGRALASAMAAAAAATNSSRRGVLIPGGATYAYLPVVEQFNGLADVTLQWEGTLALYTSNFTAFPGWPSNVWPGMAFYNCSGLSIVSTQGTGLFNGRGNLWWWYAILVKDNRNNLLNIISTSDLVLQGVTLLNSPMYHAWISDVLNADISQVTVRVDENDQLDVLRFLGGADASDGMVEVLRKAGMAGPGLAEGEGRRAAPADLAAARRAALDAVAPAALRAEDWFPAASAAAAVAATAGDLPSDFMPWALNTDGIDVSGHNITVRNCSVKNWDDSVCVKPLGGGSNSAFGLTCSTDIAIHDIAVTWGVGITMGSVPPDVGGNCIDGVHAWNIVQDAPLKGIYIKVSRRRMETAALVTARRLVHPLTRHACPCRALQPNPAKPEPTATGLIANVVYENMVSPIVISSMVEST